MGLSYVPKKILTWMLSEAREGLKAILGNRVTTRLSFYLHSFLFFFVSSTRVLVSLAGYAQKHARSYWTLWA